MTARDATTQSDPTDEVAAGEVVTPEPASGSAKESAKESAQESAADSGSGSATTKPSGSAKPDPSKPSKPAVAADDDDGTADGAADPAEAARPRRGRRRRHAADESDTDTEDTAGAAGADGAGGSRLRRRRWPLVALVLVAALFAGAMVAVWAVTRPDPIAGLRGPQQAAVDAASQAAVNLQTFRRASFDEDFANALASLTPDYGREQFADRKDELQKQLTAGARDASATVQSAGLVSSTATQAVVLVVTTTVQTADNGTSTPFVFSRLQLQMQLLDGKWLVSDLKSVGLS